MPAPTARTASRRAATSLRPDRAVQTVVEVLAVRGRLLDEAQHGQAGADLGDGGTVVTPAVCGRGLGSGVDHAPPPERCVAARPARVTPDHSTSPLAKVNP